jgi:hypothetical protein
MAATLFGALFWFALLQRIIRLKGPVRTRLKVIEYRRRCLIRGFLFTNEKSAAPLAPKVERAP